MPFELLLLFTVTVLLRIVTVSIGGGGMILIPLLVFLGLSPSEAIASNRLSFLSINTSLIRYHKNGLVNWRYALLLSIPAFLGGILGGYFVTIIDQELFKKLLAFVILFSLPLLFYNKQIGVKQFQVTKLRFFLAMFMMLVAGFMGGLFASTGIWITYPFLILGQTMLQTAGSKKVVGTFIGLSSFSILLLAGLVYWPYAIANFLGSGVGAWIGSGYAIKAGNNWVKRLFVVLVLASAIKLLFF